MNQDALGALIDDVAANGLLQPLGVVLDATDEGGELVWGDRRLMAIQALGWDVVTCRCFPTGTDPMQARLSENQQREPLSPVEEALVIGECAERGEPVALIARRFRRSAAWVEQRAAILDYPDDLQKAIHAGHLTLGVAERLAEIDHDTYRTELIGEAARVGANARTADVWVAQYHANKDQIVANQLTLDQLRAGRDEYIIRHACPLCAQESPIEQTRIYRVCLTCTKRLEAEISARASERPKA
jgi:ParB/RepB/Spo0J family partition protein